MLIQKHSLNKRTVNLIIALLVIVLGGGYFVYSQFYAAAPSQQQVSPTGVVSTMPQVSVPKFEEDIFSDSQLNGLSRKPHEGYADQYSGVALDLSVPLPPTNVHIENPGVGNTLIISWKNPAFVNFTSAQIYRSQNTSDRGELIATLETSDASAELNYRDTTVENFVRYYYVVRMANAEGDTSPYSSNIAAIATDEVPPASPTNVAVTSNDDSLTITWQLLDPSDVALVRIYRSAISGQLGSVLVEGAPQGGSGADSDKYSFSDTSIQPNTPYYYTVTAVDAEGNESTRELVSVPYHANPFEPINF
ncbi:MAG: hypothetical protein HZC01_01195 [Candidatus Kerfeldbacteria bacterium]|nr:hypothetical protein [Candidatus Kerfeldbacteria bacterium]